MPVRNPIQVPDMMLLLLEALGALLILIFIIWWTMFSGRKRGEWREPTETAEKEPGKGPGRHDEPT